MICTTCNKPASALHSNRWTRIGGVKTQVILGWERLCQECASRRSEAARLHASGPPPMLRAKLRWRR